MHSSFSFSRKEKLAALGRMAEKGLCVPSTMVASMSVSSGQDRCSDEIKAIAFPWAVYLH